MTDFPKGAPSKKGQSNDERDIQPMFYMELRRRPLRRQLPIPQGHKGKPVRKGMGLPPAESKEWAYHPSKAFVPGRSFVSTMRPIIQQCPSPEVAPLHTSLRMHGRSHESHLHGGGVSVAAEDSDYRPTRRLGGAGPQTGRVLNMQTDDVESSAQPDYGLLTTALRDVLKTSRPTSAPAYLHIVKKELIAGYEKARGAHEEGGQSHQAGAQHPGTAQPVRLGEVLVQSNSFVDRHVSYHINKVRNQMSDIM